MATKVAQKREYLAMQKSPPPFIWACPEEKNILDWHFIIRGPPDTPYAGGEYHGLIWFPSDYPFKPPDVKMFTPSGRFETGHKICMSMTSYHPSTWNAAWSVATILTGLLSFMLSDEITAGATKSTDEQKRALAKTSHAFNLNNRKFRDIFPTYATPEMTDLPDMGNPPASSSASLPVSPAVAAAVWLLGSLTDVQAGLSPSHPTSSSTASPSPGSSAAPTTAPTPSSTPAPKDPGPTMPPTTPIHPIDKKDSRPVAAADGRRGGWFNWRWIVGIVVLAVLGRLSTLAGLRA